MHHEILRRFKMLRTKLFSRITIWIKIFRISRHRSFSLGCLRGKLDMGFTYLTYTFSAFFPTHGSQPQNNVLLKLKFVTGISGITKNCGFEWKGSGLVSSVWVLHAALFRFYRRRESGGLPANLAFIVPSFKESMTSCWTIWCWPVDTVWIEKNILKRFP